MDESTKALMQSIADDAANKAVAGTLTSLGIDHAHPLDAQRDMRALREMRLLVENDEFRADMLYLRKFRKSIEGIQVKGMTAMISMVCMGGLAIIVYAFRLKLFGLT